MAPEVKTAKNSKLPKMSESCFEPVGKGGWPPISIWIKVPKTLLQEVRGQACLDFDDYLVIIHVEVKDLGLRFKV
jgi:hypothetical protein